MTSGLTGKRILVLEDEYFVASDLARALKQQGAEVIGPVSEIAAAQSLLSDGTIDAGVLDVNLAGEMSYPLADELKQRHVPFMFLTGYDGWALPDAYRDAPRVAKPFAMVNVVTCLTKLLAGETS
jgi:DNA-binding response OmpR family regulator